MLIFHGSMTLTSGPLVVVLDVRAGVRCAYWFAEVQDDEIALILRLSLQRQFAAPRIIWRQGQRFVDCRFKRARCNSQPASNCRELDLPSGLRPTYRWRHRGSG